MLRFCAVLWAAFLLSGCLQPAAIAIGVGLQIREAYCEGTTEEGKQAVRAKLTEGQKLVACPE